MEKADKKFCSTQLNLPVPLRDKINGWIDEFIPKNILSAEEVNGPDLHVTIKYGLHEDNPAQVQKLVKGFGSIKIYLGKMSVFETDPNYDVFKIDVIASPRLMSLNKLITDNLPHTDTFRDYRPHITLAYLNKDQYDEYLGNSIFWGETFETTRFVFSNLDMQHTEISLL